MDRSNILYTGVLSSGWKHEKEEETVISVRVSQKGRGKTEKLIVLL
jgi:hypothetical protein